jgi:hypothetical protein
MPYPYTEQALLEPSVKPNHEAVCVLRKVEGKLRNIFMKKNARFSSLIDIRASLKS